jgi:hypothetical protein
MKTIFRIHAIQRMFERGISAESVRSVLESGETIECYRDDKAYPSRLMLGWRGKQPLHVVAADHDAEGESIIVTVYRPDSSLWAKDFKRRKQ